MSEDTQAEAMRREVHDTLADILARHEGAMLTRWVLVAEIMGSDGDSAVWGLAPPEQKVWHTLGLLRWGDHTEAAGIVNGDDE